MLMICLVLLVLSKGVVDGLSCIGENFIEISFNELMHDEFQELFDELEPYDGDDPDDVIACNIAITVDYITKDLIIEFDTTLASVSNANITDSAMLYTTFTSSPNVELISELYIVCSTVDKCDENFLVNDDHYQWWWLIDEINHNEIERILYQLVLGNELFTTGTPRCYSNSTIQYCSKRTCLFRGVDPSNLHQICFSKGLGKIYLIIRTKLAINVEKNELKHGIDYTCRFDLCNSQSIFLDALNITHMHYNVSSMLRIFRRRPTKESITTPILIESISTFMPVETTITSVLTETASTPTSTGLNSTVNSIKLNTTSVLTPSTTRSNSLKTHLAVSIKIVLFIFQIIAFLCF